MVVRSSSTDSVRGEALVVRVLLTAAGIAVLVAAHLVLGAVPLGVHVEGGLITTTPEHSGAVVAGVSVALTLLVLVGSLAEHRRTRAGRG